MDKEINSLREELKSRDQMLRCKEIRLRDLQNRLDLVYDSFSWRITSPVRKVADWLGQVTGGVIAAAKSVTADNDASYAEWIRCYDRLTPEDRQMIVRDLEELPFSPLISVLLPVCNASEKWLRLAIESILAQLYPNWELCIAADVSTDPHVHSVLEEYQRQDHRIRIVFFAGEGNVSTASNSAMALASGDFTALLHQDDELAPHALYMVAVELNLHADADIVYSDEDRIDEHGRRFHPYFKPDWNPDLFLSQNYISRLGVCRSSLLRNIGGFRVEHEGGHDYDLCLRCVAITGVGRIRHIPMVLYHRRSMADSAVMPSQQELYVELARFKALQDHFAHTLPAVTVHSGERPDTCVTNFPLPSKLPLVSLIIPTRNCHDMLKRCISSIRKKTDYQRYEIIIVDNQSDDPGLLGYLEKLVSKDVVRVVPYDAPFNYSAIINSAVAKARGELVGLLNNDLEVISPGWLTEMVRQALRPEIGAVGCKLYYPNNTLQHGGVILGLRGIAGHLHLGVPRSYVGYGGRLVQVHNLSAVTGACLVVRKQLYEAVGGFDEENLPVAYNDVDFCLRLQASGYRNLWTPFAELYHYESYSRGQEDTDEKRQRLQSESDYMLRQWGDLLYSDPAYNPNLTLERSDFSLAFPPRAIKPWIK